MTFKSFPLAHEAPRDRTGGGYLLRKTIAGPLTSVRCSFRLYLVDTGSMTSAIPFSVALAGTSSYSAKFYLRPKSDSRAAVLIEDVPARTVDFFPIGSRAWLTLEIEAPALRLWLNGVEKKLNPADGGPVAGPFASATIDLGFWLYNPPDTGWSAAVDDIVCDVRN